MSSESKRECEPAAQTERLLPRWVQLFWKNPADPSQTKVFATASLPDPETAQFWAVKALRLHRPECPPGWLPDVSVLDDAEYLAAGLGLAVEVLRLHRPECPPGWLPDVSVLDDAEYLAAGLGLAVEGMLLRIRSAPAPAE